jgi:cyanophycinase
MRALFTGLIFCLLSVALAAAPSLQTGRLVIVGGALSDRQADIFEALLDSDKSPEALNVVIIPAASSKPSYYGDAFKRALVQHGLCGDKVEVLPLAVKDDRTTEAVDESTWRENADRPAVLAAIQAADLIWFTGGDQSRIAEVLGTHAAPSAALAALYERLADGATIGGTSAGAAIMSQRMIVGGSSEQALFLGVADGSAVDQEGGALLLSDGLGFFKDAWIDQHFDAKARLGRLVLAVGLSTERQRVGYGIDENTALIVDLATGRASVAGAGRVTRLKATESFPAQPPYSIHGVQLASLGAGDQIDLKSGTVTPAGDKSPTVEAEYYRIERPASTGVLSSYGSLNQVLSMKLIDNALADEAVSYLIDENRDFAYRLVFSKTADSRGYWTYRHGQEDHYTVTGIELSIEPVEFTIKPKQ